MEWLKLAGQMAQVGLPSLGTLLGTAFGGPLCAGIGGAVGRTAASAIGAALGVPPTPEAISGAIAADPDGARVRLAEIEADAKTQADYLADVANARQQTVQLAQAGSSIAWGAPVVSVIITLGFFGVMFLLLFVKQEMPTNVFALLNILLGVLAALFTQVGNYWLGSSDGSRRNADTIRQVAQSAVTPSPTAVAQQAMAAAAKR